VVIDDWVIHNTPKQCHYFTLWIKWLLCIRMHIITDNCKKVSQEYQLFDSTSEWRLQRPQLSQKHNIRIKSSVQNDHCPPWHKLKDGDAIVTQLQQWWHDTAWPTRFWWDVWGHRDQMRVLYISSCSMLHTLKSTGSKSGEFGGHLLRNKLWHFLSRNSTVVHAFWWHQLTSSLLCVVQVVMVLFMIFQLP